VEPSKAPRTDAELTAFAAKHLVYEATMLGYTVERLAEMGGPRNPAKSAMLEAFAVHVRCLNDFLWGDKGWDDDAFAWHYCGDGVWQERRSELSRPTLDAIRRKRRLGREVVHLSYDRLDISRVEKLWTPLPVLREIEAALLLLTKLALPERMDRETREDLRDLGPGLRHHFGISVATGLPGPSPLA
jgi:hypothetical protein